MGVRILRGNKVIASFDFKGEEEIIEDKIDGTNARIVVDKNQLKSISKEEVQEAIQRNNVYSEYNKTVEQKEPKYDVSSKFIRKEEPEKKNEIENNQKSDREMYEDLQKEKEQREEKVNKSIQESINKEINNSKDETSATEEKDKLVDIDSDEYINKKYGEFKDIEGGLEPIKTKRKIEDLY